MTADRKERQEPGVSISDGVQLNAAATNVTLEAPEGAPEKVSMGGNRL